ncbi:hypothetical protein BGZ90_002264, partial [Linnemannia elongata]
MAVTPAPIDVVPAPDNLVSSLNNDQQQQQQAIMSAQDAPDYNPQQQPTPNSQILDQDSYNGRTPQATYRAYDPTIETLSSSAALSEDYDPPGPTTQVDADIQKLAESLTLKELAGQMTQIQIGMLLDKSGELDLGKVEYWIGEWGVGSFLDTPTNHGGKYLTYSAKRFAKITGLGAQQIGLAATFNTTHAYEVGRITAKDTRAAGIPWVFAPILDVAVHK